MNRIAMALPFETEDRLAPEAIRHGHEVVARCSTAHELASRIDALRPDLALVAATERHLTERLVAVCDDAGVRIIALVDGEVARRHALSLGLVALVDAAAEWSTIEGAIPVATQPRNDERVEPRIGTVIAVWGPAGAPGRTTIAIALAAELAASGASVALADVDTYSGSVAPALGMLDEAPGFAAACRLAGADALTTGELERIAQRYPSGHSGFWVLTGIGRPSRWPELSPARVSAAITACRSWVDFTVLDTGFSLENDEEISSDLFAPRRNGATLAALTEADRVIAVGAADPVGMSRFLRAHVDLVETVASGRVVVAMNKVRASAIGLNPAGQVAQTLSRFGGIDRVVMIPFDQQGVDAAILTGRTLADAAPKSPVRSAVRELVASRLLPQPAAERSRRSMQRSFARKPRKETSGETDRAAHPWHTG